MMINLNLWLRFTLILDLCRVMNVFFIIAELSYFMERTMTREPPSPLQGRFVSLNVWPSSQQLSSWSSTSSKHALESFLVLHVRALVKQFYFLETCSRHHPSWQYLKGLQVAEIFGLAWETAIENRFKSQLMIWEHQILSTLTKQLFNHNIRMMNWIWSVENRVEHILFNWMLERTLWCKWNDNIDTWQLEP